MTALEQAMDLIGQLTRGEKARLVKDIELRRLGHDVLTIQECGLAVSWFTLN